LRRIGIVFQRDFRELRRTNAFIIISIFFTVITLAACLVMIIVLRRQVWLGKETARPMLEMIIGLIAYFMPLSVLMTFIWAFSNLTIIKEKAEGNVESLLATPLSPREIWIGKSMAIFLPGFGISAASTLIILLAVNFVAIVPAAGSFVLPLPLILISFLINPMLFLALLLFIVLFSLANNPDIAIAPSFLIGFGLMLGIPLGVATGAINLVSWSFLLWCLGGTIIFWAIDIGLYRLLTKENIVLSSRGA
jgi:ABC-type transport system involved in multi-copper enzyme maturation permease subunit